LKFRVSLKNHQITIYDYEEVWDYFLRKRNLDFEEFPCVVPIWDNSPRAGLNSLVLHGSTPKIFQRQLRHALSLVEDKPDERRLIFLKAWNEWAEGNHMEPDLRFGRGYLEALKQEVLVTNCE
jgi:hypothetical protein